jgi:integrase
MNDVLTTKLEEVRIKSIVTVSDFCIRKGTLYRFFRTALECAVRNTGISNCTFHDLRHTFAIRLAMSGVNLPTVKELMGHKSITMTLRYTDLSSDHKYSAVHTRERFGMGA